MRAPISLRDHARLAPALASPRRSRRAFTLVELLVSIAIIITVLALLVPALGEGLARARGFKCQMSLRSVAFDFQVFADAPTDRSHGDDKSKFAPGRFRLETFIESEYGVDEFWTDRSGSNLIRKSAADGPDFMRCPEVTGDIELRRNLSCEDGAVGPPQSISYTFNARLMQVETTDSRGQKIGRQVTLGPDILARGAVPLMWDVDGEEAATRGVTPHWSAPGLDSTLLYAKDRLWFPGVRHSGQSAVALIDGSVHSGASPLDNPGWRWSFQPRP